MRCRVVAALALAVALAVVTTAEAAHTVSVRVFASPPVLSDAEFPSWRSSVTVRAEVRGAAQCDAWMLRVRGADPGELQATGGAAQQFTAEAVVPIAGLLELDASVTCGVAGESAEATSEPTYVEGLPRPEEAVP